MKAGFGSGVAPEPGQPSRAPAFVPPAVAEVARLFPQFEVLELLGQGGMGAVYKARQPALDRLVALKVLPPQTSGDAGFADRFTREARALARLNHPNIVGVYEFGQAGGLHYFVMEYVEGLNLRQLDQAGRLSPREALKIIPQICDALQFAHDEGIVHRDIKPENVMLDKKGRVKITDFGLARILGREPEGMRLTGAKDVMGTPHYMAPEQVEHPQEVDHRADIYSLGVVFYEMLTGELPLGKFQAPSKKVQVDVRLDEVVLHALEKEPERRYQQASQVKTDVETIAATAPKMSMPAQDSPRPPHPPVLGPREQEAPRFTAESVRQQYLVLAIAWWIGYPVSIVSEFVRWLDVITVPAIITAAVFWFILLYRHWSLLQGHGARTTPSKAVGYGFIPIFWFYWWFVAYAGLATDNNRYLRQLGITSRRMSYGLAVTSCILGCLLCTVGWFPVGWAILIVPYMIIGFILVVQQRDCVLAMLEHRAQQRGAGVPAGEGQKVEDNPSLLTSAATGQEPRFSRTAIVGACWSAFAILAAVFWPIGKAVDAAGQMPIRLSLILFVTLVSLGVTSLLGTTILGAVAISQIRHSQGRLYGLGLAVFDVLLFPLLALNGGLIAGWIWLADELAQEWIPRMGRASFTLLVVALMVATCSTASWLIIRWVWRAANRSPGGSQAAPSRPLHSEGSPFFAGGAWHLGIIAGLALVAGLIGWRLWERRSAVSPNAVVGIEEKLARELKARVIAADFGVASVSVNIDRARRDHAECLIGGLVKYWGAGPQKPGTQRLYSDVSGGGTFRHEGSGFWSFVGNGSLQKLRFHVDASAEMASNLRAPGATPEVFKYSEPEGDDAAANPNALLAARFGPEREVTLNDIDDYRGGEALDLDSGQLLDLPKDIERRPKPEQLQWLSDQSADLLLDRVGGRWGLMTTTDNDLKLALLGNETWGAIAEQALSKALGAPATGLEVKQRGPWQVYVLATNMQPPLTFAFGTASGATGLLQITRFTETPNSARLRYKLVIPGTTGGAVGLMQREFMRRYGLEAAPGPSGKTSRLEDLSKAEQARAVELFNDIEDFGHEFEAAFATKSLPAAETGTRRLLNLLSNFNAVVRGTGYEFPPGIFEDIGKVQQALKAGDWEKVQQAARGNDAYRQAFKRIAGRMVELAREQKQAAATSFGPVVERVVAGTGDANKRFIDLDTGRQFAAAEFFGPKAEPSPAETQQWWRDTGTDAMGDTSPHIRGLVGFEMVASPVPTEEWDRLPPSRLDYYLTMSAPGTPVTMSGKGDLPATYAVKTREGAQGLLQIVGISTNNPPEVSIRYKLIQLSREGKRPHEP